MKLIAFIIRHIIPIGLVAGLGAVVFSMATPAPNTRIDGIGVDLLSSPPLTIESVERQLNAVQQAGAQYVRVEMDWSLIETSPDVYNWSNGIPMDLLISSAVSREITPVIVVTGYPGYLTNMSGLDQKTIGERWEKFIQAAIDHFGEQVNDWQIGDQINSSAADSSLAGADPAFYAKMLRAASKIIKRADSNDSIWMGSLVSATAANCAVNPLTFMLEVNGAGAWNAADVLTYQPRRGAVSPETPVSAAVNQVCLSSISSASTSISTEVLAVQDLARQLGGKTVYITGLTWSADELALLQSNRAIDLNTLLSDLLVRSSVMLMGGNSVPLIFWQIDPQYQPIAITSLANLNQLLADSKTLGQIQGQTGNVQEYRFQKGAKVPLFAWRAVDGDVPQAVVFSGLSSGSMIAFAVESPSLEATYGTPIQIDHQGNAIVLLNERPVLFVAKTGGWEDQLKASISDRVDLWKIDLRELASRNLNVLKTRFLQWLEDLFIQAKDSAVDWGEEQIRDLLN